MSKKNIYQFKIELLGIEPAIWRLIEVPSNYSFWDLHVAIQDAMGWFDCHLHVFSIKLPHEGKPIEIGIPNEEFDYKMIAGWEVPIGEYFQNPGDEANYEYDFGDSWQHRIVLKEVYAQKGGAKLPTCIAGERACPPEDCGSIPGYYHLLKTLKKPGHKDYDDTVYWLKHHIKNYHPYKPEYFEPGEVKFWDPQKRWKMAFEDDDDYDYL